MVRSGIIILLVFISCLAFGQGATPNLRNAKMFLKFESSDYPDETKNNNDPTDVNSPTYGSGKIGNAVTYNGTSQYSTVSDDNTLDLSGDYTVSAWVKTSASGGVFFAKRNVAVSTVGYVAYISADKFRFLMSNGVTNYFVTSTADVNDNTWHHVVCGRDGTDVFLVFDNGTRITSSGVNTDLSNSYPIYIGYQQGSSAANYLAGSEDEMLIWQRALKDIEASQLWAGGDGLLYVYENFKNKKNISNFNKLVKCAILNRYYAWIK
jgi:hypothetical protein